MANAVVVGFHVNMASRVSENEAHDSRIALRNTSVRTPQFVGLVPTPIMVNPTVPPELVDRVIDHLHDDKPSLGRCALVCHGWLPSSRLHLFEWVRIDSARSWELFSKMLLAAPCIGGFVKTLTMQRPETFINRVVVHDDTVGSALTALRTLHVDYLGSIDHLASFLEKHFLDLEGFYVEKMWRFGPGAGTLWKLISARPRLRSVALHEFNADIPRLLVQQLNGVADSRNIEHLSIDMEILGVMMKYITASKRLCPRVLELVADTSSWRILPFLEVIAPILDELIIHVRTPTERSHGEGPRALSLF